MTVHEVADYVAAAFCAVGIYAFIRFCVNKKDGLQWWEIAVPAVLGLGVLYWAGRATFGV